MIPSRANRPSAVVSAIGIAVFCLVCSGTSRAPAPQAPGNSTKFFAGGQIQEIYRLNLDRDEGLLESIDAAIKQYDIQDGAVLTAAGSTRECTYHYVKSTAARAEDVYVTARGAAEILSATGIIAAGEPHIHITLSTAERDAFGGHLENGCKILYVAEVTLAKFSGPPLARRPNQDRIPMLVAK
jgi:predicted DNA-binding protein with PD1-like motif